MTSKSLARKLMLYRSDPRALVVFGSSELRLWLHKTILRSYSQSGEDRILDRLLDFPPSGFYVDVGANHPVRFSNTKRFYDRGWRGINIEPNPVTFATLAQMRPRDLNLNMGVAAPPGALTFYRLFPDTLSTFVRSEADAAVRRGFRVDQRLEVAVQPLQGILDDHLRPGTVIDFLSVDTEGSDFAVLSSLDWAKHTPAAICVEAAKGEREGGGEVNALLDLNGYVRIARTRHNWIYAHMPSLKRRSESALAFAR